MDSPLMEELDAICEGKSKLDLAEEIWRLRRAQPEVLPEQVRRLKLWHHRGEAHGLTVEQVDAVFDAAARAQPEGAAETFYKERCLKLEQELKGLRPEGGRKIEPWMIAEVRDHLEAKGEFYDDYQDLRAATVLDRWILTLGS